MKKICCLVVLGIALVGIGVFAHGSALATIYTINVSGNGDVTGPGSVDCPDVVCVSSNFGSAGILSLHASVDPGWEFFKWTGDEIGFDTVTGTDPTFVIGAVDRVINAAFQRQSYMLAASGSGGGSVTTPDGSSYYYDDTPMPRVVATANSGWEFTGWLVTFGALDDPTVTGATTRVSSGTTGNTAVTTNFQKISYTLDTEQAGDGTVTADTNYVYDDNLVVSATPDAGWEFVNWTGADAVNLEDANLASTRIINPTIVNTIVTANFQKISYTLDTEQAGDGTVTADTNYFYDENLAVVATPDAGWEFVNWTGADAVNLEDTNLASTRIINPTIVNTTVTANFQKISYTLDTEQAGDGTVTADTNYVYDENLAVVATPDAGWEFANWTGVDAVNLEDANLASTRIINPTIVNTTVTANFQKISYTLDTSQVGNGTVTADTDYVYDVNLAVVANPDAGWEFANWTGVDAVNLEDANLASTRIINPTISNTTVTANFQKIVYNLTTAVNEPATCTGNTVSPSPLATYVYDDSTSVSATAVTGCMFVNWTGSGAVNLDDPNSAATFLKDPTIGHTDIAANFIHIEYPLAITVQGTGTVTNSPSQATYHYGDIVGLQANVGGGEVFIRWEQDLSGSVNPENHTIHSGNNQVRAVFGHIVTATADTNGTITPDGSVVVDSGDDQNFVITPGSPAYCVDDVVTDTSSNGSIASYLFSNVLANHTIDATFRVIYTFTGYVEPPEARFVGTWRLKDDDTGTYLSGWKRHGESLEIPCGISNVSAEYSTESCGSKSMPVDSIVYSTGQVADRDLAVTGTYDVPTYDLTIGYEGTGAGSVSATPAGGVCGGESNPDCSQTYSYLCNTTVTVRAVPDNTSLFDEWSGGVVDTGNSVTTITLFADQSVQATFENIQYTLSVGIIGTGGSVIPEPGSYEYDPDEEVTLVATPDAGYLFVEWVGDVAASESSTTTILMDEDQTVNAVFRPIDAPEDDNDGDGFSENDGDCNDFDSAIYPGADEICGDGIDQNCDGIDPVCVIDNDGDGVLPEDGDCDDNDPTIYGGIDPAPEICGDGIDQDCNGSDLACTGIEQDNDGDGYTTTQGDCNDGDEDIHPGAVDICGDTIDQDCYDGDRECDPGETCVTIDDEPLNSQIHAAAANVMFLLDDSGSMDWSILRTNGATYLGYDYLFDNAGDNNYGPQSQTVMSRSERRYYLSQWNGDNNMYYNPATYYFTWASNTHTWIPNATDTWPSMPDADLDYPRSNPMNAALTLDFRSTADVLLAGDALTSYMTLWQGGGQRVEVARVVGSTNARTLADAVRLVHQNAPSKTRLSGNNNDGEEKSDGVVALTSGDLDMLCEASPEYDTIGIRFTSVLLPLDYDSVTNPITEAYIEFNAQQDDSSVVSLRIQGELIPNSPGFATDSFNISSRLRTTLLTDWNVPAWTGGQTYLTPDIHHIVEEIVGGGWVNGNPMTFIITEPVDGGCRRAIAHNQDPARAPMLILRTATSDDTVPDIIIDNNDDLFAWEGNWRSRTDNEAHMRKFFQTTVGENAGNATNIATWLLNMDTAGLYHVFAWVPDWRTDIDDNAPYTIYFNGGSDSGTVYMNQLTQNNGGNAAMWHELLMSTATIAVASAGSSSLAVVDTGHIPDVASYTYTFTVENDTTQYTLQPGTTATSLVFTPVLSVDAAADAVVTFNQWWTFAVPATQRVAEHLHRTHYYTEADNGDIYLVVVDTHNIDTDLDDGSFPVGETIKYYKWEDTGNNVVDFSELTQTTTPPAEVQPKKSYVSVAAVGSVGDTTISTIENIDSVTVGTIFSIGDFATSYTVIAGTGGTSLQVSPALTTGIAVGDKVNFSDVTVTFDRTYIEEKQNFVNWYSFFRRRELTAKAAVGRVIADMSGVKIGIHTIHSRVNQEVFPVKPEDWDEMLYDYVDPATTGYGDACGVSNQYCDETDLLLTHLYSINSTGGTPLRLGLERVGHYFDDDDGGDVGITGASGSPYANTDDGGACQQAFTIAMTDGYYNGGNPSVGDADSDGNTSFDGAPYADNPDPAAVISNTLADVAMEFYERDLSSSLDNQVPITSSDSNPAQHMVTYGVAFGVQGQLPDPVATCPPVCNWPETMNNQGRIDDLFHASVNGRGSFFTAKDPQELVDALLAIKDDIELKIGSGAAVGTTPSGQLSSETFVFQGIYNPEFWSGDIWAFQLYSLEEEEEDRALTIPTGILAGTVKPNRIWSAEETIERRRNAGVTWWDIDRVVVSYNGTRGVPFRNPAVPATPTADELTIPQLGLLGSTAAERQSMIEYLRGDTSNEQPVGDSYRARGGELLGDFIHSSPVMVETYVQTVGAGDGVDNNGDGDVDEVGEIESLILAGANDGGLHAFNPNDDGDELLFYLPGLVYADDTGQPHLTKLGTENPNYTHQYFVDGTVYARRVGDDISDAVLAVGGLQKGGKGYYLLNVSELMADPSESNAADIVKWEYPNPNISAKNYNPLDSGYDTNVVMSDSKGLMGYSYAQAYIVRSNADIDSDSDTMEWMVAFGNGYESSAGKAALIILGIDADGDVLWRRELDTGSPHENQPVTSVVVSDGGTGYVVNDSVSFTGGTGSGASGHVASIANGIQSITGISGGSGYAIGDTLDVNGGNGSGAQVSVVTVDTDNSDAILTVSVTLAGTDYVVSDSITFTGGTGSGAAATVDGIEPGSIETIVIDDGGSGYDGTETITVSSGSGSGSVLTHTVGDTACNGLSSTALVDVNFDGKVDFAYGGDLYGNMWKFDLRSTDPTNWQIAYCDNAESGAYDSDSPGDSYGCVESLTNLTMAPQPLVTVQYNQLRSPGNVADWESTIQPITMEPDVVVPCKLNQSGYLITFGTGRYLSTDEIGDTSGQTIYGIWDWAQEWVDSGEDAEPYERYLGTIELPVSRDVGLSDPYPQTIRKLSEPAALVVTRKIPENDTDTPIVGTGVTLLEQTQITDDTLGIRVLSNHLMNWYSPKIDKGEHVGWFFNLPGVGERVATGLAVRDGILDIISTQPSAAVCSSGIVSIIHGINVCTGGRPSAPYFDYNGDGKIDSGDLVNIGSEQNPMFVAPTGVSMQGMIYSSSAISIDGEGTAVQARSASDATLRVTRTRDERKGVVFWREMQ